LTLGAAGISLVLTLAIAFVPSVRFAYPAAGLHVLIESIAAVVAGLTAYLVFLRFVSTRLKTDLLLACSLAAFGSANVLLALFTAGGGIGVTSPSFAWTIAIERFLALVLLVAAALVPPSKAMLAPRMAGVVVAITLSATAILAAAVAALSDVPSIGISGSDAAAMDLRLDIAVPIRTIQLVSMALFFLAGFRFTHIAERSGDGFTRWLGIACTLAAFSRLNYFFFPSLYTKWVFAGDAFRLAFYAVMFLAALREIQRYWKGLAAVATLEERQRIARDLHDGVAQELAYIGRHARRLDQSNPVVRRILSAHTRGLNEARRAVVVLSQPSEEGFDVDFAKTMMDLAARLDVCLQLDVESDTDVSAAEADVVTHVACEAITNAAVHGNASTVSISLRDADGLEITIEDDGLGFSPKEVDDGGTEAYGLRGMKERVARLGGHFTIDSAPGTGTRIEARL
jgi:signal transduction histidine kinase